MSERHRILIVEDEALDAELLERELAVTLPPIDDHGGARAGSAGPRPSDWEKARIHLKQ